MPDVGADGDVAAGGSSCITSKIYNFGVLSFCYRIPFKDSFEDLKLKILDIKKALMIKARLMHKRFLRMFFLQFVSRVFIILKILILPFKSIHLRIR